MGKGMAPTEQLLLQRKQWDRCPIPVEPDITVIPTLEDLQHHRDPVLERAMSIATGQH